MEPFLHPRQGATTIAMNRRPTSIYPRHQQGTSNIGVDDEAVNLALVGGVARALETRAPKSHRPLAVATNLMNLRGGNGDVRVDWSMATKTKGLATASGVGIVLQVARIHSAKRGTPRGRSHQWVLGIILGFESRGRVQRSRSLVERESGLAFAGGKPISHWKTCPGTKGQGQQRREPSLLSLCS